MLHGFNDSTKEKVDISSMFATETFMFEHTNIADGTVIAPTQYTFNDISKEGYTPLCLKSFNTQPFTLYGYSISKDADHDNKDNLLYTIVNHTGVTQGGTVIFTVLYIKTEEIPE